MDKAWVKGRLDDIFLAPDKETGFARLQQLVADLADRYPGLADFLSEWIPSGEAEGEDTLSCLNFPPQHRRRIRTTNGLERWLAGLAVDGLARWLRPEGYVRG